MAEKLHHRCLTILNTPQLLYWNCLTKDLTKAFIWRTLMSLESRVYLKTQFLFQTENNFLKKYLKFFLMQICWIRKLHHNFLKNNSISLSFIGDNWHIRVRLIYACTCVIYWDTSEMTNRTSQTLYHTILPAYSAINYRHYNSKNVLSNFEKFLVEFFSRQLKVWMDA